MGFIGLSTSPYCGQGRSACAAVAPAPNTDWKLRPRRQNAGGGNARIVDRQSQEFVQWQSGGRGGGGIFLPHRGRVRLIRLRPHANMIGMHAHVADGADETAGELMLHLARPVQLRGRDARTGMNQGRIGIPHIACPDPDSSLAGPRRLAG